MSSESSSTIEGLTEQLKSVADEIEMITTLHALSRLLLRTNSHAALVRAREALLLSRRLRDRRMIAISSWHVGDVHRILTDYAIARRYLSHAARVLREFPADAAAMARVECSFGGIHYTAGEFEDAIACFLRSIDLCRQADDREWMVRALESLGETYRLLGDYPKSLEVLLQGKTIAEEIGSLIGIARILSVVAAVHHSMYDNEKALEIALQCIEIEREIDNRRGESVMLANAGMLYRKLGQTRRAMEYLKSALALNKEFDDRRHEAVVLVEIARLETLHGEYDRALELCMRALAIGREIDYKSTILQALRTIGDIHIHLHAWNEAIGCFDEVIAIAEKIGYKEMVHDACMSLGRLYEQTEDFARSIEYYRRAKQTANNVRGHTCLRKAAQMQVQAELKSSEREKERYRSQLENMRERLERKTSELTMMALELMQRDGKLREIEEDIRSLGRTTDTSTAARALSLVKRLRACVSASETAVERLRRQIDPDFIARLTRHCSELTPTELKVCVMLRATLTSKDIAEVLNLSIVTVETHRRRIRKKLRLATNVNLTVFLASL